MPVTRIEIQQRAPYAGGKPFGASGPYEYLTGILHFASDPRRPDHAVICDLGLAPSSADGQVEYRAEFHLLKPTTPSPNGRLLVDSVNCGNMTAVPLYNSTPRRTDGNPDIPAGNGFLFREGYSVLCVGVQWDPPEAPERMRAWFPEAMIGGQHALPPGPGPSRPGRARRGSKAAIG